MDVVVSSVDFKQFDFVLSIEVIFGMFIKDIFEFSFDNRVLIFCYKDDAVLKKVA